MKNIENLTDELIEDSAPEGQVRDASRRALLKAGWAVPVILAVTPPSSVFATGSGPPNGEEPNGEEPNGEEPNGEEPNGEEPPTVIRRSSSNDDDDNGGGFIAGGGGAPAGGLGGSSGPGGYHAEEELFDLD